MKNNTDLEKRALEKRARQLEGLIDEAEQGRDYFLEELLKVRDKLRVAKKSDRKAVKSWD